MSTIGSGYILRYDQLGASKTRLPLTAEDPVLPDPLEGIMPETVFIKQPWQIRLKVVRKVQFSDCHLDSRLPDGRNPERVQPDLGAANT